jgi:Lrp/AsnC family transcriptional regulator, regulator for asnA, asnC and gidA
MRVDGTSRRIIEILQRDGRCPNTVIARAVGISEASVRSRINALTAAGILQIVGLTDPGNMGFGVMAMIAVQANTDLHRIADIVSSWRETTYVVISAGSFDLLVEVVCADNRHLLDLVQRLRDVDGINSSETFMYLDLHKQTFSWGTR